MSVIELLATLKAKDIQLALKGDQLLVQGNRQALTEPEVLARLREYKPLLIEMIRAGQYSATKAGQVEVPANGILPGTVSITPQMLPLVQLSQEAIERIVASVPGGAANVQDIYPLAPLQEGILYHHLSAGQGDPYVMQSHFAFDNGERLEAFAQALQAVIERHDILRTAVLWEGLEAPVQVVWRKAELSLLEVQPDPADGEILGQLHQRFDARHYRMDVTTAPLIRLVHARDDAGQRIVAMLLFHHMALDHSALEVVRHEMRACLLGQGHTLGPAVPFRNYVAQARLGMSEQEHEAFFREMLGDIDEPTLPFGLQDVQGDGNAIDELSLDLDPLLCQRLRGQARQQGVSAASLFHLAWAQVLGAVSGRDKVVFGTVLMGRMQGGGDNDRALGIFINTLPFRVDVDGQSVQAGLKATHARLTTLLRHEHAPLALAQRCSGVSGATPLFSALLNYRHSAAPATPASVTTGSAAAWQGIATLSSEERTNYPLTMSVDDLGEGFRLTLLTSPHVDPQRLCAYLRTALEQLAQALEQTPLLALNQLPILPPAEREQLLVAFNDTQVAFPRGQTISQRFEARVLEQPDAVAALYQGQALSYDELNRRANALAHHLLGLGVQPDDRVAIVARRGLDTLAGLLAILKAGACYVPVDPSHPAERLSYLLDDSQPVAVLTQAPLRARLPALEVPVIELEQSDWPGQSLANPQLASLSPAHLAYVIYTSGSTGLPKGVMVEHRTLVNLVDWHCQAFDLVRGRHASSLAGFGFDAMAWEIWPALCAGATLHLAPAHEGTEDIDGLLAWWCAQPLDVSFLPTPVAEYAFGQNLEHPTLRTLLIGGDRLRQFSRERSFAVINNYGPTEATVVATSGRMAADRPLHIGRPMANARVYLLDGQQRPVPVGVAGELYVGGAGVARGYLHRPQMTAERFLQDPFSREPQARMYRTGDLARWLADGTLEYLGRNDDQVKIRGVRIELGEIESGLNQFPGIKEAVLLAREDEPGQPRLVAYFTEQAQVEALQPAQLRDHLLARLPDYMVPVAYVKLEALPLTANGKLDRRALPKPDRAALFSREYQAPQGGIENALAQIWAEVLQVERVGRQDHFFELGGHSLLAMRMVSQVRLQLGVELALGDLFANAELAAVAEVLARAGRSTLPDIIPVPRDEALPLSFAQQRLWFLAQMEGTHSAYNIPVALGLRGQLDSEALQRALARIVARHDSLRSRFVLLDDQPRVLIAPAGEGLALQLEDLGGHLGAQAALRAQVLHEAAEPFDLQHGPLIRGRLLRLADAHHVLLLTLHHIVADGWSMGVLTRELVALYSAFSRGEADPLPALAVQYSDFAVWQRRWLGGELLQRQSGYWQQALAGAPALLMLPTDRPRPAQQDYTGASLEVRLDERLSAGLKALSQRHGTTLYMTVMAGWALLLGRLAGQSDLVIGSPVANRMRAEVEGLIGLFVNTLAVRLDVDAGLSIEALLAQVRTRTLEAQSHQDLPFEQVVEVTRPLRSLSHSPLFQTMLAWENTPGQALVLGDLQLEGVSGGEHFAKFDLALTLGELSEQGQIAGSLVYARALFDESTLRRYLGYFESVLQAMVSNDQLRLADVSLLDAQAREHVLRDFNASRVDFPAGQTIHGRFEVQAALTPDALAVQVGEQALSYRALNEQANQLAHHLREQGVVADARVAICVERGPQMLVGLLAILKAGGAYVPLDPAHPPERLAYLLEDSAPVAVLVQGSTRGLLGEVASPLIDLQQCTWQPQPLSNPQVPGLSAQHLVYVIYTSGSTGLPKGVMVEHATLDNLVNWHNRAFELGPGSHTSSVAGFGFDAMAWEVWPALCAGATLHLPPASLGNGNIDGLLQWWRGQPLDVSFLPTPVAEHAFNQHLTHPTLRTLLIGGDRLRQFVQAQGFAVVNNYGPTEATVVSTSGRIEAGHTLHIGQPIANARIYLLDEQLRPVPIGVAGELYVGGAGVARGYLNRPQMTAERFLDDPFSDAPRARMYRSGDLARWLADGSLDYLGRNDDQVKIRGVRIELGEIETRLNQYPGVEEAVLLAREDEPGQIRLVAYFTEHDQAEPLVVSELRAHLLAQLPDYMVPVAYVKLSALPLTANGKLDRRALPKPDLTALFSRAYEAPEGEIETLLAQIWAQLLQVERVGRRDHFFELGGHSLLAMRLVSQVRLQLGLELALGDLFGNPELAAVAEALVHAGHTSLPDILPVPDAQAMPLSFAQQRLWFLAQMEGASSAYNIPLGLELRGRLDADALQQALERIVERHATLRSRFVRPDDQPQVVVAAVEGGRLLRRHAIQDSPEALSELIRQEATRPFDLEHGPLIRGHLLHLADAHHVLLLTVHHIVCDGWSMGVLTRELMALYSAFSRGQDDPLPALSVQYGDFAVWQRRWLGGDVLHKQSAYWQQALAGAPALLMLPADRPRPAQQDYAGASVELRLDESLSGGLRALSQRHGTTLYMTLLAAWAVLLSRLSGQHEVVIGSPVANRMRAEVEDLIGLFVNTLALRIDVAAGLDVEALLAQVKARTLEAQAHQDLPFEQVVDITKPLRSLSYSPLFQSMLTWEERQGTGLALGDLQLQVLGGAETFAKFDLALNLGEAQGRIGGSLVYATALFDEATIRRYAGYFERVLRAMVADDQALLEHVPLLDEGERKQLLLGFNATAVDYDLDQHLHGLFEAQVQRSPDAVALVADGCRLSYRELDARANQLAHHLREQGVGPDARVAICVERGVAMVVGLLAILKAGGGYVPIDPSYPLERIGYMLQDSAPIAVLVQGASRERLGALALPVIDLEHCTWSAQPLTAPRIVGLNSRHLAYVIYTSGSTGQPKGVMNEHGAVVNRLLWMQDEYRLDDRDAVLQKTPFSFDVSVWEFFWPLMTGARLVMARPEGHKDPVYLGEVIAAERISTLHFVPSMLDAFLAHGDAGACAGLVRVMCSGEALPGSLVRRFKAQLPGSQLHNLYGPTEAAVDVTAWHCTGPLTPDNIPIGKPIANTRIYLLDGHMQPVPRGVVGELYIGGVQVARGYLNREQLSAERFLKDPFSHDPQARLYRTGDVGRYLADGNIEYLGRNDDQVKIRGLRIELGEIQACLTRLAEVKEAVVIAREDRGGDKRLVAYCTCTAPGAALDSDRLRSHLLEQLPDYMVPALFVHLEALPLSVNGKLDRKALPAPDLDALARRGYEAPVGATEILLAGLWAELLQVERVGRHDHFFELGGHSLLAVNLIGRMRRAGMSADVRVLFGQPTLAALAAAVGSGREIEVPANRIAADCLHITPDMLPLVTLEQSAIERIVEQVPGGVANVQDIYPLAPLQAGILYHHLLAEQGDPYLLQAQFAFSGSERLEAFAEALQAVIRRNDILRTAVLWDGLEEPVQVVWREAPLHCEAVQVRYSGGDVLTQLHTRFDPRHHRLDLAQAPLMRLYHAWDQANQRVVALLLFHHLVMDHVGLDVLQQEVAACLADRHEQLAGAVPYRNYVAQTRLGIGEQEHERFFREMLGDIEEPTLPFGLAQVQGDGRDIEEARRLLDAPLSLRLRAQARQLGVSAASLMHLAWARLLGAASGQDQVVFGTVLFGRMQGGEGAERALGVFINTLPLRVDLGRQTVRDALLSTHERLARLLAHEHAPLALVQRCSAVAPPTPLFSALLNYRHSAVGATATAEAGAVWDGIELLKAEERSNYLLTLSVDDLGDGFMLSTLAAASIGAQRVCDYMHTVLENLLLALEQAPQRPVGELTLLTSAERQQLLEQFNATRRAYPREQTLSSLFEAQVRAHPQARAAVHGERSISYGELNRRANLLAHRLLGMGVQPGDNVALLLPRSFELLIAQLAINKCAAAYVPLDIQAPAERQGFMLEDSRAVLLLTLSREALEHPVRRLDLDRLDLDRPGLDGVAQHGPDLAQSSEAVAYIMYTSGSTGAPKGVRVPHRAISRLVINNGYADFNPLDRLAFASNPAFDASTMDVWGALLNGGQVVVIDHHTLLEPAAFAQALSQSGATVLFLTTALFNQYTLLIPEALKGLRMLLCGGERADPAAFRRLLAQAPQLRLVHCYGPTETTTYATTCEVTAVAANADSVPVGAPIANTRVYVLDAWQQPVPPGVSGEIYIGGQGVAKGYLNRPELNAEKFLPDPFDEQPDSLMYRTGDLGRWLAGGQLECMGRTDDQVKIRGFRIELGEVEHRLAGCAGVKEVLVMARDAAPGDKRLVAYYTLHAEATALDHDSLRSQLQGQLPEYMLPSALVRLERLPLTANGKVDRKALPEPLWQAMDSRAYEAPVNALEQTLARLWGEVLQVERVGRHDSFFELGGHSLLAIRLLNRLEQDGLKVTLAELFQHASVESVATLLSARTVAVEGEQSLIEVRRGTRQPGLFLVHEFSGMELYFPALGRHIAGDFPIYGLPGIAPEQPQLQTMECLAARLVRLIRSVQPEGPYRLAGWSFGGVLAYEVAQQLLGQDQQVGFLGLIDSYVPRMTDLGKARWTGAQAKKRHLLLQCEGYWKAQGASASAALASVEQLGQEIERRDFAGLVHACRERQVLSPPLLTATVAELENFLGREVAHGHAMAHYTLHPLAMPVHLFYAEQRPSELSRRSPSNGWAEVLGNRLQQITVPGDHMSMMQAPQVQHLGQALSDALASAPAFVTPPAPAPLVTLQSGRGGFAPVFCVPGAGDSVTGFIGLTDALGPDWPILGLQPRGLDGQGVPHSLVESAAEYYLRALEHSHPQGPVHLIGHSFGGWVAYEMAALLHARGREVASLTLIDSESPGGNGVAGRAYTATAAMQRLIEALQLASGKSLGLEPLAFAGEDEVTQLRLLHAGMVRVGLLSPRSGPEAIAGTVRTFASALRTLYQPHLRYPGRVRLVLAQDPSLDSVGNLREQEAMIHGWRQHAEALQVWHGPGNHFSLLKAPDVYSLAAWWHEGLTLPVGEVVS